MIINQNNNKTEEKITKSNIFKIVKGSLIAIIICLILLLGISFLLTITNIPETIIPTAIICISAISVFIGSLISTKNIKSNGLINGGAVGLIFNAIIYLLSSFTIGEFGFNIKSMIMILVSVFTGLVGGIVGVNMVKN